MKTGREAVVGLLETEFSADCSGRGWSGNSASCGKFGDGVGALAPRDRTYLVIAKGVQNAVGNGLLGIVQDGVGLGFGRARLAGVAPGVDERLGVVAGGPIDCAEDAFRPCAGLGHDEIE